LFIFHISSLSLLFDRISYRGLRKIFSAKVSRKLKRLRATDLDQVFYLHEAIVSNTSHVAMCTVRVYAVLAKSSKHAFFAPRKMISAVVAS